jgi:hypothetical protein
MKRKSLIISVHPLRLILILSLTFVGYILHAETIIPKGPVKGQWVISGSPYKITGDIYVPADKKLKIEAGVKVQFQGNYTLKVYGNLVAKGTKEMPVYFIPRVQSNVIDTWKGIRFRDTLSGVDTSCLVWCIIKGVKALEGVPDDARGGAVSFIGNNCLFIRKCKFLNNSGHMGAALYACGGEISVTKSVFKNNASPGDGGAMFFEHCSIHLNGNEIMNNTAGESGGAISAIDVKGVIENNLISGSIARYAAGINIRECEGMLLAQNTFAGNQSATDGGGLHTEGSGYTLVNSILWDNHTGGGADQVFVHQNCRPNFNTSDIEGGMSGIALLADSMQWFMNYNDIMNEDPQFAVSDSNSYSLDDNSPCIDMGITDPWLVLDSTDAYDNPRVVGYGPDLGAFEYDNLAFPEVKEKSTQQNSMPEEGVFSVSVYPNPTGGRLYIQVNNSGDLEEVKCTVYNPTGLKVFEQTFGIEPLTSIDLPQVYGAYFMLFSDNSGKVLQRLPVMVTGKK